MKHFFTVFLLAAAVILTAADITPAMPFKKGTKTPIEGWQTAGKITLNADKSLSFAERSALIRPGLIKGKAGDKVVYEIVCKIEKGDLSLRLGQWSPQGWMFENPVFIRAPKTFKTMKGEIILKDANKPDKAGIIRKVDRFSLRLYSHSATKGIVIKSIKVQLVPKK